MGLCDPTDGPCEDCFSSALANHGILPRNGRHISPSQLASALCYAYNLSPTLANQLALPFEPLWTGVSRQGRTLVEGGSWAD